MLNQQGRNKLTVKSSFVLSIKLTLIVDAEAKFSEFPVFEGVDFVVFISELIEIFL